MKRVMMVDDERPVLDGISLLIRRDLSTEFEIVGTATSGREAIEKIPAIGPDIVLMDVSMPGIGGLDAISEIRKRGSTAIFILITAYERFDIAHEAVKLGVLDYLLKPVVREKLAQALRSAASLLDQQGKTGQLEVAFREREHHLRQFVETALLHGIMLGEDISSRLDGWRRALEIKTTQARVVCGAFLPPPGALDARVQVQELYHRYQAAVRFKTSALVGPLVGGRSLGLFWVRSEANNDAEIEDFRKAIRASLGDELRLGLLRVGIGSIENLAELDRSWQTALADLLARPYRESETRLAPVNFDFETDSAFIENLLAGDVGRARMELERLFLSWIPDAPVPIAERYRIIGLLSTACRKLVERGLLAKESAAVFLDLRALHDSATAEAFQFQAEHFLDVLVPQIGATPLWSAPIARTVAWIRENYGSAISLESAAELCNMSTSRLSKLFIAQTGQGFSEYLIGYRIARAKEMLSQPGASIKQVSTQCGYPDPNYFARLFKKETGATPSSFAAGKQENEHAL